MWCCYADAPQLVDFVDLALNHVREMRFADMGDVRSAVDVGDGAVVAAQKGLFMVSYAGRVAGVYLI